MLGTLNNKSLKELGRVGRLSEIADYGDEQPGIKWLSIVADCTFFEMSQSMYTDNRHFMVLRLPAFTKRLNFFLF